MTSSNLEERIKRLQAVGLLLIITAAGTSDAP